MTPYKTTTIASKVPGDEGKAGLNDRQLFALRWIDANEQTESQWLTKGKPAKGHPRYWDQIEISGPQGSIRIHTTDWSGLAGMIEPAPHGEPKIFALTDAARAALSRAKGA